VNLLALVLREDTTKTEISESNIEISKQPTRPVEANEQNRKTELTQTKAIPEKKIFSKEDLLATLFGTFMIHGMFTYIGVYASIMLIVRTISDPDASNIVKAVFTVPFLVLLGFVSSVVVVFLKDEPNEIRIGWSIGWSIVNIVAVIFIIINFGIAWGIGSGIYMSITLISCYILKRKIDDTVRKRSTVSIIICIIIYLIAIVSGAFEGLIK
jgi:hypothetical protein